MDFKEYTSKPIKRVAARISEDADIVKLNTPNLFRIDDVVFVAYDEVQIGDYVIYLNDKDVYHCSQKVFEERNYV